MKVLITAFEPFGGEKLNSSLEVLKALPLEISGAKIEKCVLPVSAERAPGVLFAAIGELLPAIVICLGQGAGSGKICLERFALNIMNMPGGDSDGFVAEDRHITEGGQPAYEAALPLGKMAGAASASMAMADSGSAAAESAAAENPAESPAASPAAARPEVVMSYHAGAYLCNFVFYKLMERAHEMKYAGGFIHLPATEAQAAFHAGKAAFPVGLLAAAVEAAVAAAVDAAVEAAG